MSLSREIFAEDNFGAQYKKKQENDIPEVDYDKFGFEFHSRDY